MNQPQKWIKHKGWLFTPEFIETEKKMYSAHYDNVKNDKQGFVTSVGLPKIFIEKGGKYVNIADETEEVNEVVYLINTIGEYKMLIGFFGVDTGENKTKLKACEERLKYLTNTQ